jgi:hypothetical protein
VATSSLVLTSGAAILPHPSKVINVPHLRVCFLDNVSFACLEAEAISPLFFEKPNSASCYVNC